MALRIARGRVASGGSWRRPTKVVLWLLSLIAAAALVQGGAWLVGLPFNILAESGGGRAVLITLAAAGLLVLMAGERRPLADYGLVIDQRWSRHVVSGLLLGVASYGGYYVFAFLAGAVSLRPNLTVQPLAIAVLTAFAAFALAFFQEILFRGYVLSTLCRRLGWISAVLVVSCVFAFMHRVHDPLSILTARQRPLFVGMFLIGALLAVLRLYHGNIVFGTSLLSGWIYVEMLVRKSRLVAAIADPACAQWLCPERDPRRGAVMWLALAVGTAAVLWRWRRSEGHVSHQSMQKEPRRVVHPPHGAPLPAPNQTQGPAKPSGGIATTFKLIYPLASMSMLAPLDLWLGRLWHARFAVGWRYLPRLVVILLFSTLNTLLSLPERCLLPLFLRRRHVPDPLFIVGVPRSGTTHLHNLLALDRRFVTPRTYQVMNPRGFLFSGWLLTPLFAAFSPWRRPMDAMRSHLFSANEEEFALANLCRLSPYWGTIFPRLGHEYDRCLFPERLSQREWDAWKKHYLLFLRKLLFWRGKQPLLKNPCNTARVALLQELFPGAKFIHIYRDPYRVYRSNERLAHEGHCLLQLQDPAPSSSYPARFLNNYAALEEAYYRDVENLPPNQFTDVRFEDLEGDPIREIRRVYHQLGLPFQPQFRRRLQRYLEGVADYQKNRFSPLGDLERRQVCEQLRPLFRRWGYEFRPASAPSTVSSLS